MKASQVLLVVAAAVLSCEARHWAAGDDRIPEDDADTVFTVEERPAFPFAPEHLEPYVAQEGVAVPVVPVVPQPHSLTRRSTTVFRPLFATRERDAERREQQERRREYWAGEERRRSAAAYAAPRRPQPQPYPYRPYPGAYPGAYAAYPAAGR